MGGKCSYMLSLIVITVLLHLATKSQRVKVLSLPLLLQVLPIDSAGHLCYAASTAKASLGLAQAVA